MAKIRAITSKHPQKKTRTKHLSGEIGKWKANQVAWANDELRAISTIFCHEKFGVTTIAKYRKL